jgi:hypothetical protein
LTYWKKKNTDFIFLCNSLAGTLRPAFWASSTERANYKCRTQSFDSAYRKWRVKQADPAGWTHFAILFKRAKSHLYSYLIISQPSPIFLFHPTRRQKNFDNHILKFFSSTNFIKIYTTKSLENVSRIFSRRKRNVGGGKRIFLPISF